VETNIITELLDLPEFFVKEIVKKSGKNILILENRNYPVCPHCKQTYMFAVKDKRFQTIEDLSAFGKRTFLRIHKRRINCECGYKGTEYLECMDEYQQQTNRYQKWIYAFCKRMTGLDVARLFGISKHTVYRLDKKGIKKELAEQEELKPKAISIAEISRKKGHRYMTIISAPILKKIIFIAKERKTSDITPFFKKKGEKWCKNIAFATMDAWPAFRKAVKKYCKNAVICFDHFHLAQHFGKAIDKLRIAETRKAAKNEREVYKGTRWLLLKNPENLKDDQRTALADLLKINENLYTAYLLRGEFRQIFKGETAHSRLIRLSLWIKKSNAVNIPEIKKFVHKIIKWKQYIENSLRYNYSNSFAEGINVKIRVIQRMAYGYKDFEYLKLKIFQQFNFRGVKSLFAIL